LVNFKRTKMGYYLATGRGNRLSQSRKALVLGANNNDYVKKK